MKRIGVVGILVLAFAGLSDAIYLAQHEISGTPLLCNIQNLTGCNVVANSPYSYLFGIPVAEFGVLFYAILFVLASLELVLFDRLLRRMLQGISLVCVLASFYFAMTQIFLIKAFCIYCTASAIITLLIFILATLIEPVRRRPSDTLPPAPPSGSDDKHAAMSEASREGTPLSSHLSMPPAA